MAKECVCGAYISNNRTLCRECAEVYGISPGEWPEWFRWKFNDLRREHVDSLTHDHLIYDDIEPNGRGGYKPKPAFVLRGCREQTHLHEERSFN